MASKSRARTSDNTRIRMMNAGVVRSLALLLIVSVALAMVPLVVPPVHSAGNPTVFVTPLSHATVATGVPVNYAINVSNMPLFSRFLVFVKTDPTALDPVSNTHISFVHTIFPSTSITVNCADNVGRACGANDGPGIVDEDVSCLGCSVQGNGELFNINYTSGSTASSVVDVYNVVIGSTVLNGVAVVVNSGSYGTTLPADYAVTATPFSISVPRGKNGNVTLTYTSLNGFVGTIALTTKTFPASPVLPLSLNVTSVTLASGQTKFVNVEISPTSSTGGSYTLIVNGTGPAPALLHQADVAVIVTTPDFTIAASPTALIVPLGSTNTSTITLTSLNTFAGQVNLTFTVFPILNNAPTLTLNNSAITGKSVNVTLTSGGTVTATLRIVTASSTNASIYTITVTGKRLSLSHPTAVSINVVPFTMTASPASLGKIAQGGFALSTLSLSSLATYPALVTISSTTSPNPANSPTVLFSNATTRNQNPINVTLAASGTATATLNFTTISGPLATTPANYTVTVTGQGFGIGAFRILNVTATVTPVDFIVSATSPADFNSGATGSSTITITPVGAFTGTVSLATSTTPSTGLTPNCLSSLTVTGPAVSGPCNPSSSTPGSYRITITASGGGRTHTANFISHVGDFIISATSPSGSAGASLTSAITLTSTFSFAGTVALTNNTVSGLSCSALTSTSISLTANGTGSSTLTCTAPLGTFTVTITSRGSPGTTSHSALASFNFGGDFVIIASSPADFNSGAAGSSTITVTPSNGFTGAVTLVMTTTPSTGLTPNCPASLTVSGPVAVTGTCSPTSTAPATYLVTIIATGGGRTHNAIFVSHVGDFSIFVGSPVNFNAGSSGASIPVSLTSSFNFVGTVALSVSPPTGLTVTCPTSATSLTANATVSPACGLSSITAGIYMVMITGTASPGTAIHQATSVVTVIGVFTLTNTPVLPAGFVVGDLAKSNVTLNSIGLNGKVTLTTTVLPMANGPSALLSNYTSTLSNIVVNLTPGSSITVVLTVSSTVSTAPGLYSVNVTATSGAVFRSFIVTVTVSVAPNIIGVNVSPSGTAASGQIVAVTVTVLNSGTVNTNFTIRLKWGANTVAQVDATLAPGQQKSFSLPWDTAGLAGTNTLSVVTLHDGTWSNTFTSSSYTLSSPPQPFFTGSAIAAIGGVVAAGVVVLLIAFLLLRRRRVAAV